MITQALLKELLHYCPDTGEFTWLKRDHRYIKNTSFYQGEGNKCEGLQMKDLLPREQRRILRRMGSYPNASAFTH